MTGDEWYKIGAGKLDAWYEENAKYVSPGFEPLSSDEMSAFMYAWELAGEEMGIRD